MMKYLLLVCLIFLASAAVPQLTRSNIQSTLGEEPLAIVKFFSPGCGHCIAMAAEYQKLYEQSQGKKYKVYEVDCSVETDVCSYAKIEGYPTLRLYSFGGYLAYDGERTAQAMDKWMNGYDSAALPEITAQEAQAKIGHQTFVLVSGLEKKENRDITYAKFYSKIEINMYSVKSSTAFIRLYKKGSEQFQQHTKDANYPDSLLTWAFNNGREAVLELTTSLFSYIKQKAEYLYIMVVVEGDSPDVQSQPILEQWCEQHRNELLCLRVGKSNQNYDDLKQSTRSSGQKTTISIIKSDFSIGYHYSQEAVTADSLTQFFEEAKDDKIYRAIDQEREARAKFESPNILRLTKQIYNQTIEQNDFVFVQYYSPRCGHCINYAEGYKEVAAKLKELNPSVIVGNVDASAEEEINAQQGIEGFPTFKMYAYGQRIDYPGQRQAEDMIKFITKIYSSQLLTAQSKDGIAQPFIAIGGIQQKSKYDVLPALFQTYPIYHITGQSQHTIQLHVDGEVKTYNGEQSVQNIVDWIIDESSPVLVSLGESVPSAKLSRAIRKRIPLLVILNKHQREFAAPVLSFLEQYCNEQTEFVCGYVHKDEPDYDYLLEWSGDTDKVTNRLVWINTQRLTKYLYEGDPNSVTKDSVDAFVNGVKEGTIEPHTKEKVKAQGKREELQEL